MVTLLFVLILIMSLQIVGLSPKNQCRKSKQYSLGALTLFARHLSCAKPASVVQKSSPSEEKKYKRALS